jgi:hypothetical protein
MEKNCESETNTESRMAESESETKAVQQALALIGGPDSDSGLRTLLVFVKAGIRLMPSCMIYVVLSEYPQVRRR